MQQQLLLLPATLSCAVSTSHLTGHCCRGTFTKDTLSSETRGKLVGRCGWRFWARRSEWTSYLTDAETVPRHEQEHLSLWVLPFWSKLSLLVVVSLLTANNFTLNRCKQENSKDNRTRKQAVRIISEQKGMAQINESLRGCLCKT